MAANRVALEQPLGGGAIGARQHAEGVFGGQQFVFGQGAMVEVSLIVPDSS